jgi:hypothetical protein
MLHWITRWALRLDEWLQATLGRPYHALLGIGLTVEIVRHLFEMPKRLAEVHRLVPTLLIMAMEIALLIHQVGALHHHVPKLGRQRGRRGRRGEALDAEVQAGPETAPAATGLTPPPPAP